MRNEYPELSSPRVKWNILLESTNCNMNTNHYIKRFLVACVLFGFAISYAATSDQQIADVGKESAQNDNSVVVETMELDNTIAVDVDNAVIDAAENAQLSVAQKSVQKSTQKSINSGVSGLGVAPTMQRKSGFRPSEEVLEGKVLDFPSDI